MATLQLAIQTARVQTGSAQFVTAVNQVRGAARVAATDLGNLDSKLNSTGNSMSAVAKIATTMFAGFLGIQGLKEAIRTFAEFEQTMASIQGVTSATATEMRNLKAAALDLGASSRSSANEAADGLLILSKAGFSTISAIEALPSVLALATAHQLDLGQASDYTANILNQFTLQTSETERVVDVLSTTANKSLADVRDLAEAMKYAGPAAGALGISVEEAAAAAGVLSDRGIKASLAGTNLRGMMLDLIAPTAKAKSALKSMDLDIRDVDIRLVGFTGALKNLAKAGASVEDIVKIFGVMQTSGAAALIQNTKRLDELTIANDNAAGSTKKLVDIMQDTLKGRFKEFTNILGVAIIQLGEAGLGLALKNMLVGLTDGIRLLTGFGDKLKGNRETAERVANAIKLIGTALAALAAAKAIEWTVGLAAGFGRALFSVTALNVQLAVMLGIMTAIVAVDFGTYLYEEFGAVRSFGNDVAAAFQTAVSEIEYYWDIMIVKLTKAAADFINWLAKKLSGDINPLLAGVMNGLSPGSGSALMAAAKNPLAYDGVEDTKRADAAREKRQQEIAAGYVGQQDRASLDFARSNRMTGDGYIERVGAGISGLMSSLQAQAKGMNEVAVATDTATQAGEAYKERTRDLTIFNEEAHEEVLILTANLNAEADALRLSQREKNALAKVNQFITIAEEAYGDETKRSIQAIRDYTDAVNKLEDAKADRKFNERIRQVVDERNALSLSSKERRIAIETAQFHAAAQDAYGRNSLKAAEQTAIFHDEVSKLADDEELRKLADNIGDAFGKAFEDMVFGAKSAREAVEELTKSIIKMIFQQLVSQQISNAVSGGIMNVFGSKSANGNVFMGGSVVPFANGGIVGGPTIFPMTGGKTGLMGENGPEAIMPLSRGPNGKLGVEVSGQGSKNIVVPVTVISNTPGEFRGSERQIANKLRAALQRI